MQPVVQRVASCKYHKNVYLLLRQCSDLRLFFLHRGPRPINFDLSFGLFLCFGLSFIDVFILVILVFALLKF